MAKRTVKSAKDLARIWEARRAFLARDAIPRTWQGAVAYAYHETRSELISKVYGSSKKYRSQNLKEGEILVKDGPDRFIIRNIARSADGAPYPLYIHDGRRALTTPTKTGKKYYAWVDAPKRRPTSGPEWSAAIKAGYGHLAKRVKAVKGKPWRKRAVTAYKSILKQHFDKLIVEVHRAG